MDAFTLEFHFIMKGIELKAIVDKALSKVMEESKHKARSLGVEFPPEFKKMMSNSTSAGDREDDGKEFACKICGKTFKDGRQLGGHTSRKHKDD